TYVRRPEIELRGRSQLAVPLFRANRVYDVGIGAMRTKSSQHAPIKFGWRPGLEPKRSKSAESNWVFELPTLNYQHRYQHSWSLYVSVSICIRQSFLVFLCRLASMAAPLLTRRRVAYNSSILSRSMRVLKSNLYALILPRLIRL